MDTDTEVEVSVRGGGLVVRNAVQDMGNGSKTLLARAVASVFDVDPTEVIVEVGRAGGGVPHGPTSGGSRTTASIWSTTVEAATKLQAIVGADWRTADGALATATCGGDHSMRAVPFTVANLQVGRGFTAAVHVTEVEVDPHTGVTLTSNLEDCRIPQLGDTSEITIHFHEPGWEHVPGGGVGLGEVATISPAASVGNAIFNATGFRPTVLPVRPDRLLEGLR